MRRVVVTGLGVVASNGSNVNEFKSALYEGKSGIKHISELQEKNFVSQIGGIPETDANVHQKYFQLNHIGKPAGAIVYGCMAAEEAWIDAGLERAKPESNHVNWESGIILGTGIGGADVVGNSIVPQVNAGTLKKLGSSAIEQIMVSGASAYIGGILSLGNRVSSNSSACSTGAEAIITAYDRIRLGGAERMLAGGTESYSPYIWAGFDSMRVLNRTSNETPEKASRPLSASASGFVPSAGAGVLVLEEMEFAIKRGVRIYAELIGGSVNCGGQKNGGSITAPNPEGVQRCIQQAIEMAEIAPEEIDAISGHLTSTMADPKEVKNWSIALNRKGAGFPYINSVKSMIGHSLGAAGGIESVATILQLHHGFLHPSINCEDIHPEISAIIDPSRIPQQAIDMNLNIIAKASFGFGDVNSCLIFKKWNT